MQLCFAIHIGSSNGKALVPTHDNLLEAAIRRCYVKQYRIERDTSPLRWLQLVLCWQNIHGHFFIGHLPLVARTHGETIHRVFYDLIDLSLCIWPPALSCFAGIYLLHLLHCLQKSCEHSFGKIQRKSTSKRCNSGNEKKNSSGEKLLCRTFFCFVVKR